MKVVKKLHLLVEDALDEQDPVDLAIDDQMRRVRYAASRLGYVAEVKREQGMLRRRQLAACRRPRVLAKVLKARHEKISVTLPGTKTGIGLAPVQDFLDVGTSKRRDA